MNMSNQKMINTQLSSIAATTNENNINELINSNENELRRFKSHEAYFSSTSKVQKKSCTNLKGITNDNKIITINLNESKKKPISYTETKNSKMKKHFNVPCSPNKTKHNSGQTPKNKNNFWSNSKVNSHADVTNKTTYLINNLSSNKFKKRICFDNVLNEQSIQELDTEDNDVLNTNSHLTSSAHNNINENNNIINNISDNNSNSSNEHILNKELLLYSKKGDKEKILEIINDLSKININYKNENGWTALHYACDEGNIKIVEILVKSQINVNLRNNEKKTPLHISVYRGYFDISKILVENGAEINCTDNENNLPLHICALYGYNELLAYLLKKNSTCLLSKNNLGETPYDLAKQDETKMIIKKYIKSNKHPNLQSKNRNSSCSQTNNKISSNNTNNNTNNNSYLQKEQYSRIKIHITNQRQIKALFMPMKKQNTLKPKIGNITNRTNQVNQITNKNTCKSKKGSNLSTKITNNKNNYNTNNNKNININNISNSANNNIGYNTNKNQNRIPNENKALTDKKKNNCNINTTNNLSTTCPNALSKGTNPYYTTSSHIKNSSKKAFSGDSEHKMYSSPIINKKPKVLYPFSDEKKETKIVKTIKYQTNNKRISSSLSRDKEINQSKLDKIKFGKKSPLKKPLENNFISKQKTQKYMQNELNKTPNILSSQRTVSLPGFNDSKNNQIKKPSKQPKKFSIENNNLNNVINKNKKNSKEDGDRINSANTCINRQTKPSNNINININPQLSSNKKNLDCQLIERNKTEEKKEFKVDQICTDEEDGLIEDLEEEILENLPKEKVKKYYKNLSNSNQNNINISEGEDNCGYYYYVNDNDNDNDNDIDGDNEKENNFGGEEEEFEDIEELESINESKDENINECQSEEKIGPSSFICLALLGQGSFGEVYLVKKKDSEDYYAMKVLDKKRIEQQNIFKYAITERNVLSIINFPFIVKLNYAFQTKDKLFLLLDYCPGGDLSKQLQIQTRFPEDKAKFYICEIILAIGELHKKDIIFRDLKPDNIVIDKYGHAMLTDFGLSREGVNEKDIAKSFCGSIAYLAPEMLSRKGHGKAVDWYLLGVVFFEMLVGVPPFYSNNQEQIFKNIEKAELYIPKYISKKAQILIRSLLKKEPSQRLGSKNDVEEIKVHPYFSDIDWDKVFNRQYKPPPVFQKSNQLKLFEQPKLFIDNRDINPRKSGENKEKNIFEGWSFVQNGESKEGYNNIIKKSSNKNRVRSSLGSDKNTQ